MLRHIFLIFLFYSSNSSFGQNTNSVLSKIRTVSQAEMFIEKNPKANWKVFTIESSSDTSELLLSLYDKKNGFTFKIDNNNYKILQIDSTLSFRVNYIYLNGEKLSKTQIDSLRQEIISRYKDGTSFLDLVQQYNMDGNNTGDTKWFTENMMVKDFETSVRSHKKGDIFAVETPNQKWYHIVLKTYDDTFIRKLTILKTKSSNSRFSGIPHIPKQN